MVQQGSSRRKVVRDTVHLDFLRKAMEWVVDASIFENIETHGNTKWIAKELVMLAVLWVWSEKSQLTAAFGEAMVWSQRLIGRAAVGSYQALTNALVTYGGQLVPLLWNRLQRLMENANISEKCWCSRVSRKTRCFAAMRDSRATIFGSRLWTEATISSFA